MTVSRRSMRRRRTSPLMLQVVSDGNDCTLRGNLLHKTSDLDPRTMAIGHDEASR
jgi:hypothetical protein